MNPPPLAYRIAREKQFADIVCLDVLEGPDQPPKPEKAEQWQNQMDYYDDLDKDVMLQCDGATWMVHSSKAARWGAHRRTMAALDSCPIKILREFDLNELPRVPPAIIVDAMVGHMYFNDYTAISHTAELEHGYIESPEIPGMNHQCLKYAMIFHLEMLSLAHHLEDEVLTTVALNKVKQLAWEDNAKEWEALAFEVYGEYENQIAPAKFQKTLRGIVLAGALKHEEWIAERNSYVHGTLEFSTRFPRDFVCAQDMWRRIKRARSPFRRGCV